MARAVYAALAVVLALTAPVAAQQNAPPQPADGAMQKETTGRSDVSVDDREIRRSGEMNHITNSTANGEVRHSGKVVEISDNGSRFVIEEMVAWQGPEQPGIIHRSVDVTPRTAIQLVERQDEWGRARTSLPGWQSKTIEAGDLRVGDFITVTTDHDARSRAVSLQVIRPGL